MVAHRVFAEEALSILRGKGVYLLFDPRTYPGEWEERVVALYELGIPWFQLRAKGARDEEVVRWAKRFRDLLPHAILLINDRPDLALLAGAHGVHLGPRDPSPQEARRILGPRAVIGASGDRREQLIGAGAMGVDYFGVGTYRYTPTKPDAGEPLGLEGLKVAQNLSPLPKVAIGGILPEDLPPIRDLGYYGVAVHRGIWFNKGFLAAARAYLEHWRKGS